MSEETCVALKVFVECSSIVYADNLHKVKSNILRVMGVMSWELCHGIDHS